MTLSSRLRAKNGLRYTPSAVMYPTPREGNGLLDAYTDIIGGEPYEVNVRGVLDGAVYVVDADKKITIPADKGGGNVTWLRGVWPVTTKFRWDGFMADPDTAYVNDPNYASEDTAGSSIVNLPATGQTGALSTVIQLSSNAVVGSEVQVYYNKRSGVLSERGAAISGWPNLYTDVVQGTANDGDTYMMWSLDFAYRVTGLPKYARLRDRIGRALLEVETSFSNELKLQIPLENEPAPHGVYTYYNDARAGNTFSSAVELKQRLPGTCYRVIANVPEGQDVNGEYGYAGWGVWTSWSLSESEPFQSFNFKMLGDGSGRSIEFSSNILNNESPEGDISLRVPMLAGNAGQYVSYVLEATDFWKLGNVAYSARHVDFGYDGAYVGTGGTASLADVEDVAEQAFIKRLSYDFSSAEDKSAGAYFGVGSAISTSTPNLVFDMKAGVPVLATITLTGFDDVEVVLPPLLISDVRASYELDWGAVVHPISEIQFDFGADALSYTGHLVFDFIGDGSGYAGAYFRVGGINSSVGAYLDCDLQASIPVDLRVTVTSSEELSPGVFKEYILGTANVGIDRANFTYVWPVGFVHPLKEIQLDVTGATEASGITIYPFKAGTEAFLLTSSGSYGSDIPLVAPPTKNATLTIDSVIVSAASLDFYSVVFGVPVTMADSVQETFGGFEFTFPSSDAGQYDVSFADIRLVNDIIDGPLLDRQRYLGIPRWTYKWTGSGDNIRFGNWRGRSATGYLWMPGWIDGGIAHPDSNYSLLAAQVLFMKDAQDAYEVQFPAYPPGMIVPRYGRPSWEAHTDDGYIAGVNYPGTYNQWFTPPSDNWHGYHARTIVSLAALYAQLTTQTTSVTYNGVTTENVSLKAMCRDILLKWLEWCDLGETNPDAANTDWEETLSNVVVTTASTVFTLDYPSDLTHPIHKVEVAARSSNQSGSVRISALKSGAQIFTILDSGSYGSNTHSLTDEGSGVYRLDFDFTGNSSGYAGAWFDVGGIVSEYDDDSLLVTLASASGIDENMKVVAVVNRKVGLIADWNKPGYWRVPSSYDTDGLPSYSYRPTYSYALFAQAFIFMYWAADGNDPIEVNIRTKALKWYRRMLDSMFVRERITATGYLAGVSRTTEGSGYSTATVVIDGDGAGATANAFIAGGKVRYYEMVNKGSGYTWATATIVGDGTGATCRPYLIDQLYGAFSDEHTGWEVFDIYNTYAMLVLGECPGVVIHNQIPRDSTQIANDLLALDGLETFFANNTGSLRPSIVNEYGLPVHEYDIHSYHNGAGIEGPMSRDTHAKGAMWTETLAPYVRAMVFYGLRHGDYTKLNNMYKVVVEMSGGVR